MRLFAIDNDNNITAFPAAEQIPEGQEHFASEKELAKLATNWPGDRLRQDLEQLRRRGALRRAEAGQEVHGPQERRGPDLEGHPTLDAPAAPQAAARCAEGQEVEEGGQGRSTPRPRRAKAARRPSSSTCSSARTARRSRTLWRRPTGRRTACAALSPAASPRRWASTSNPSRRETANAAYNIAQ